MTVSNAQPGALPVLLRDRLLVWASLGGLALLAWAYLIRLGPHMGAMDAAMSMPRMGRWAAPDFALHFGQWAVMMVGMMLPASAPMALGLIAIVRARSESAHAYALASLFTGGYLVVWAAYSGLATLAQWGLQFTALAANPLWGGALLVAAGLFQWTPLKNTCLFYCRSPFGFFLAGWREGGWGAVVMGLRHGVLCAGCCSLLMALMLFTGAMNLLWMSALAALVLFEKALPHGDWVGRAAGLALAAGGVWLALGGLH